jgi:hypothetical protein
VCRAAFGRPYKFQKVETMGEAKNSSHGAIDGDAFLRTCRATMTADELEEFWKQIGAFESPEAAMELWKNIASGRPIGEDLGKVKP